MKAGLTKGASLTWFLISLIASGAIIVLWKLIFLDAPPSNSLLITSQPDQIVSALVMTPTVKATSGKATRPTPTSAHLAQVAPASGSISTPVPDTIQVYV